MHVKHIFLISVNQPSTIPGQMKSFHRALIRSARVFKDQRLTFCSRNLGRLKGAVQTGGYFFSSSNTFSWHPLSNGKEQT